MPRTVVLRSFTESNESECELVMVPSAPWMSILEDKLNAILDSDMSQHAKQLSRGYIY